MKLISERQARTARWSLFCGLLALTSLLAIPLAGPRSAVAENVTLSGTGSSAAVADGVIIRFNPSSTVAQVDDLFVLNVEVVAGDQSVNGAEVHIDFDPALLRVVDASGNPVGSITLGTTLNMALANTVDNAQGHIDFSCGTVMQPFPTGTFVVGTIRFKALADTGGGTTSLSFVSRGASPTNITGVGGASVLGSAQNGTVTIGGASITPTATGSSSPTATSTQPQETSTPTNTPTSTRTPTATPSQTIGASPTATTQLAVYLDLSPLHSSVAKGDVFLVDVRVLAGVQPVKGVEVHIDFDPALLQVVDGAGNPTNTIVSGTTLDVAIDNRVDNSRGTIDCAYGTFSSSAPSGTFVLATIRFKAMWGTGGTSTPLAFVARGGNPTDVTYGETSVLAGVYNGSVTISGELPPPTPTSTATSTRTATPTATMSPTPTSTPTATVSPTATPLGGLETLRFQQGVSPNAAYRGVEDTYLNNYEPGVAMGQLVYMLLHTNGSKRPMLKFDLTEHIPQGSPVVEAKLGLWMYDASTGYFVDTLVYRVNRSWQETTATWEYPWTLAGCEGIDADREGSPSSFSRLRQTGLWVEWDVTALVREWVSGSASNEGMLITVPPEQLHREAYFRSSNFQGPDQRPYLVVSFYRLPPTATPTTSPTATATPTATQTRTPVATATPTEAPGRIEGRVWEDRNLDQVADEQEPGLAGALVQLYRLGQMGSPVLPPVTTGSAGTFSFEDLVPGWYVVRESNPEGYLSSTSDEVSVLVSRAVTSHVAFGDYRWSLVVPIIIHKN